MFMHQTHPTIHTSDFFKVLIDKNRPGGAHRHGGTGLRTLVAPEAVPVYIERQQ